MKILVVGGHSAHKNENEFTADVLDFFRDAIYQGDIDGTVEHCYLDMLVFWVSKDSFEVFDAQNGRLVSEYDLVIFRGKIRSYGRIAHSLSEYLAAIGVPFLNDYRPYRPTTKLAQAITMRELGLPFAATLCAENMSAAVARVDHYLRFPLIAKDTVGTHGNNNYLVRDKAELQRIVSENPNVVFLFQEYIPNDCDYRIFVLGSDEVIIKRQSVGDSHLHNTSQGGRATLVSTGDFSAETLEQAHAFAERLRMTMAGVDVMRNTETGQLIFLEINSQPQLIDGAFPQEKKVLFQSFFSQVAKMGGSKE